MAFCLESGWSSDSKGFLFLSQVSLSGIHFEKVPSENRVHLDSEQFSTKFQYKTNLRDEMGDLLGQPGTVLSIVNENFFKYIIPLPLSLPDPLGRSVTECPAGVSWSSALTCPAPASSSSPAQRLPRPQSSRCRRASWSWTLGPQPQPSKWSTTPGLTERGSSDSVWPASMPPRLLCLATACPPRPQYKSPSMRRSSDPSQQETSWMSYDMTLMMRVITL